MIGGLGQGKLERGRERGSDQFSLGLEVWVRGTGSGAGSGVRISTAWDYWGVPPAFVTPTSFPEVLSSSIPRNETGQNLEDPIDHMPVPNSRHIGVSLPQKIID